MATTTKYNVGDTAPGGMVIDRIYGQTESVLVYRTRSNSVAYWADTNTLSSKDREVLRKYDDLSARVFAVLPKWQWNLFVNDLGSALFNGLTATDPAEARASFHDVETLIVQKTAKFLRFCYLLSALVTAVVLGAVFFALYHWYPAEQHRIYALCIVFAMAGAMASAAVRSTSVELGSHELTASLVLRGSLRIVMGAVLAAFLVVACKANLILGMAATTHWSLLAFSFVSGISERFVPEMLSEVEKKASA